MGVKGYFEGFRVSSLKINFHKSNLFGINVDDGFLMAASHFLHCSIGVLPFKFLGLPIGANPRRSGTWKPVIDKMCSRLSSWKGKQLSLGGRVVMINSVLTSMPLYFLSFFKIPKKVLKTLIDIQRSFLWSRCDDVKKVATVNCGQVCKPKNVVA